MIGSVAVIVACLVGAAWLILRGSLPRLDGRQVEAGLLGPVVLERDALGVVTITAADRDDLAYGTGFAHGQDRFFQMDLARRLAAGELSELVGPAALAQDRVTRTFRFRAVAQRALAEATPHQRALLDAYARGVNAGLASLRSSSWEYWVLRARPAPWRPEDSILVVFAMWWQLQSGDFERERVRREIDARLGGPRCAGGWKCALSFLYPQRTAWDAPNELDETALRQEDGRDAAAPPVPGPDVLDVRSSAGAAETAGRTEAARITLTHTAKEEPASAADIGSNGWVVAGRFTASGGALVASDMHLPLGVPPTWYRVRLRIVPHPDAGHPATPHPAPPQPRASNLGTPHPESPLDLVGLTLPGAPALVAGSNGRVAWAFTNADGKWIDVRPIACLAVDDTRLRTESDEVPVTTVEERIHVRGEADVVLPVRSIPAGLLLESDPTVHRCWVGSWIAERPDATNMGLIDFERATSVKEVLALAPQVGIPEQNLVVGDSAGHIGWTIAGRVPVRPWSAGTSRWVTGESAPQLYDPPLGRIWTANARATADPAALAAIGGADAVVGAQFDLGARARQIRDALLRLTRPATVSDMLRIQLDDRAVFVARWRDLMLRVLDESALNGGPQRAEMRHLLEAWDARADVDSVGYRLVRAFHDRTAKAVWRMILHALHFAGEADTAPESDLPPLPQQFEQPLWVLVTHQPLHWLAAEYPDWRSFLLRQLDETATALAMRCGGLARCRWGEAHPVHIRHPLSRALPALSSLIDLPLLDLPGDHDMPRVQDGAFGASERFAVVPGHEAEGYVQLPGGQSDHPLSPYYRAGFRAWAEGRPLPFLPGRPVHQLVLLPRG